MSELYVALLRGINVGGHRNIAMADLRDLCEKLGFENPRTLLASGNLVFGRDNIPTDQLERGLEMEAARQLNLYTDFLVRSANDWQRVVESNPFFREAEQDPGHLLVMFLKRAPDASAMKALESAVRGREVIGFAGTEAYITYPDGIGRSKLTNSLIESKLGMRGTGRNWNTVLKLAELLGG